MFWGLLLFIYLKRKEVVKIVLVFPSLVIWSVVFLIGSYIFITQEKKEEILTDVYNSVKESLPELLQSLKPFPLNSKLVGLWISEDKAGITVVKEGQNEDDFRSEFVDFYFDLSDVAKGVEGSLKENFKKLCVDEEEFQGFLDKVEDYFIKAVATLDGVVNFVIINEGRSFAPLLDTFRYRRNPDMPDDMEFSEEKPERLFFDFRKLVNPIILTTDMVQSVNSSFDLEKTEKELAEEEMQNFLYYIGQIDLVGKLNHRKKEDPYFDYSLTYQITDENVFEYSLETWRVGIEGDVVPSTVREIDIFTDSIASVVTEARTVDVNIKPESRKLFIQNPVLGLDVVGKFIQLAIAETQKLALSVPQTASIPLTVAAGASVALNAANAKVGVNTEGAAIGVNVGTAEMPVSVPADAKVDLDVGGKTITLNTEGQVVALDINGVSVPVNFGEGMPLVIPQDAKIKLDVDGQKVILNADALKNENGDIELPVVTDPTTKERLQQYLLNKNNEYKGDGVRVVEGQIAAKKLKEYDPDGVRTFEGKVAEWQKKEYETTVNDGQQLLNKIARDIAAWKIAYSNEEFTTYVDTEGNEITIKKGYKQNIVSSKIAEKNIEAHKDVLAENQSNNDFSDSYEIDQQKIDAKTNIENTGVLPIDAPEELTDYDIHGQTADDFFSTDVPKKPDPKLD